MGPEQPKKDLFLLANCLQIKKELQTFVCNPLIFSVGIPGFEPGTPCSQSELLGVFYSCKFLLLFMIINDLYNYVLLLFVGIYGYLVPLM